MFNRAGFFCLIFSIVAALSSCGEKSSEQRANVSGSDSTQARALLEANAFLRDNLTKPEAFIRRARVYDSMGMIEPALRDVQAATRLDSMNGKYFEYLGDLYLKRPNETNALGAYSMAVSRDPNLARAYMQIGRLYLISKQRKLSIENLNNALKLQPTMAEALLYKGMNYKEDGNAAAAKKNFQAAIDLRTDYFEAYEQMGLVLAGQNDPAAIKYLEAALRLKPGQPTAQYALALTYQQFDSLGRAKEMYHQMLEREPNNADANNNLGVIALREKKYKEALDFFNKALTADPDWAMARENRAKAFDGLGDKRRGDMDRQRAKELSGGH